MNVGPRVARRLIGIASSRGLIASDAGPLGRLDSLRDWALEHEDHCGARWISSPAPEELPLRAPRSVVGPVREFEAALARLRSLPNMCSTALEVAALPGARLVTTDGLVITHDGLLATESAWDEDKLQASGVFRARLPRARIAPGLQASLITQWCETYYHWMTDALPRLAVLEAAGCSDAGLIVPEPLTVWQQRSLELLGVADRLTPYTGYLRADTLLWPRPVAHPGHTPRWACEWLRRRLVCDAQSSPRRLYLTRRGERRRTVANEAEVWALLEPMGFELIDSGTLPLDEQIDLFASATTVVSPHGGALANIIFGRSASVVELFEPSYINLCYYVLADRCEHEYWYLVGDSTRSGAINVDVAQLADTLAAAGL